MTKEKKKTDRELLREAACTIEDLEKHCDSLAGIVFGYSRLCDPYYYGAWQLREEIEARLEGK